MECDALKIPKNTGVKQWDHKNKKQLFSFYKYKIPGKTACSFVEFLAFLTRSRGRGGRGRLRFKGRELKESHWIGFRWCGKRRKRTNEDNYLD